jgi:hypothetical protein
MAAPNLKNPTTITGRTARYAVTTSLGNALANSPSSGKVFKINSIFCAKETYFYLEEGDSIRAVANAAGDLDLIIGYEDIS